MYIYTYMSFFMYIYIYTRLRVCIYVYIHIYIHIRIYMYIYIYIYVHIDIWIYSLEKPTSTTMFTYIYYVYIYIYIIYMYVYMYTCIHRYMYMNIVVDVGFCERKFFPFEFFFFRSRACFLNSVCPLDMSHFSPASQKQERTLQFSILLFLGCSWGKTSLSVEHFFGEEGLPAQPGFFEKENGFEKWFLSTKWALAGCEWRAATPGLKLRRLPRARIFEIQESDCRSGGPTKLCCPSKFRRVCKWYTLRKVLYLLSSQNNSLFPWKYSTAVISEQLVVSLYCF